uniref:G-protein coupled receptors family 1 profile domain-containing protein n=1 Tax=Panagrolaimus sp. ES5 TaxID=591445 RepID=A0AC34FA84_9BILA
MQKQAAKYDPFFIEIIEPSMVFVDSEKVKYFVFGFFALDIIIIIFAAFVIVYFIYLVQTSKTATKMQQSLIISSTAQISITLILLFIPLGVIIACVGFQIPHTSEYACLCFSITSFHGILEFIATLYFVLPYRRYLKKQISKVSVTLKISKVHVQERPPRLSLK